MPAREIVGIFLVLVAGFTVFIKLLNTTTASWVMAVALLGVTVRDYYRREGHLQTGEWITREKTSTSTRV